MAARKEIPICIFKPLRTDTFPLDGHWFAQQESATLGSSGRRSIDPNAPSGSLILTAWALLLKYYLATDFISFASLGIESSGSASVKDGDEPYDAVRGKSSLDGLIHSLEVVDQHTISDIVRILQAPATQRYLDLALLPYTNTLLLYRPCTTAASPRKIISIDDVDPRIARQIDICLSVTNDRGLLSLEMVVSASKFAQPVAGRILQTYRHILELISTASPGQTVGNLDPLTGEDWNQICKWNSSVPRPRNACLHTVFEEQAQSRPQAPAVCSWDRNLTYAELNAVSTNLAHHLSRLGVGPEIFVPYGFEKSSYAVVTTLAILKAGGAFVPLDFSHPRDRLKSIINRVGARLILASAKTAPAFRGLVSNVLVIDQNLLASLPEEKSSPYSTVSPGNSAFVLFTSGSTGEPKGLVQEHKSVCTINDAYGESLFVNEESRVLNFAAYTFDVSTVDVFTTLSQGGCVCIPSEEDRLNDIVRVINDYRVNWVDLTPSFAMASISRPEDVPTLKTLILAGEEVKREHVVHFVGKIDRVINCYGPAEAGGCLANCYKTMASQSQTVGRALNSATCWIADVRNPLRLAPIGAIGELVVEGPTLARGYIKDPSKTDKAFFYHPGWRRGEENISGRRFYRTGDLVRYRPDGLVDFVGRQDTQVKIRGQRIELTEVEQHISGDVTVKQCLIELPQSGVFAKRLVAVIEPRLRHDQGLVQVALPLKLLSAEVLLKGGFALHDLTKRLAKRIPAYMMPVIWLLVTSLPLTDSKKVDRRTVRGWLTGLSLSDNLLSSTDASRIPLIPVDDWLAIDINRKVSSLIANGNNQVFSALDRRSFDLVAAGLDSIQVVTLSKWILDEYGHRISVDKLTCPGLTVNGLAQVIAALQDGQEPENLESQELDILNEVSVLSEKFFKPNSVGRRDMTEIQSISTVLLTGGNGFLGTEILHQLLRDYSVKKIIVLVRATSARHGRERVVAAAKRAKWWSASFDGRLEIWPGDLGRIRFGLSDAQWGRIAGTVFSETSVDAVIHNGAAVRWDLGYESLRGPNTISTLQLLEAMAERRSCGRFVYVSGGQVLTTGTDDEDLMTAPGMHMTGYAQTKVVSELLVKRFAESEMGRNHIIRVVKPSYIIGDAPRGMGNPGDYLWRLTKSAVELGSHSKDGCNGWLFVSDVVTVARAICQICSANMTIPFLVKILDGVVMQDFWNLLVQDFGYHLRAVDGEEWWGLLRSQVERTGSQHCLWALQDILEAKRGEIASTTALPTPDMTAKSLEILRAVRSNVQYLRDRIGFLPSAASYSAKL